MHEPCGLGYRGLCSKQLTPCLLVACLCTLSWLKVVLSLCLLVCLTLFVACSCSCSLLLLLGSLLRYQSPSGTLHFKKIGWGGCLQNPDMHQELRDRGGRGAATSKAMTGHNILKVLLDHMYLMCCSRVHLWVYVVWGYLTPLLATCIKGKIYIG